MFVLSQLLTALTQPATVLLALLALATALVRVRPGAAQALMLVGLMGFGALGFRALPDALLRPLENRYPVPTAAQQASAVGVIVLGGALQHPDSFKAHGQVPLGESAERMTVPLAWMRQHPQGQLVFTGGEGRLLTTGVSESDMARAFYTEQGLPADRLRFESRSRNTRENAQQVAQLLGEQCQRAWLLVSSAWHLPRAVPEFEAVGCRVIPYPVDFRTGPHTAWTEYSLAHSLLRWQVVLHELVGLGVYSASQRGSTPTK